MTALGDIKEVGSLYHEQEAYRDMDFRGLDQLIEELFYKIIEGSLKGNVNQKISHQPPFAISAPRGVFPKSGDVSLLSLQHDTHPQHLLTWLNAFTLNSSLSNAHFIRQVDLTHWKCLREIKGKEGICEGEKLREIFQTLPCIKKLIVRKQEKLAKCAWGSFLSLKGLEQLEVENQNIPHVGFDIFCRQMASLKIAKFAGCYFQRKYPGFWSSLSLLSNIQELDLSRTDVDSAALSYIGEGCKELRKISLNGCKGLKENDFFCLSQFPNLEEIRINGTAISEECYLALLSSMKKACSIEARHLGIECSSV
jgi:hypothetical protein